MRSTGPYCCLGCGKTFADPVIGRQRDYQVCATCAEIMQQGRHKEYFKVLKAATRNLDHAWESLLPGSR